MTASDKTIERLSQYRRLLENFLFSGKMQVFSHELASALGRTAEQIRQDIRVIGYSGRSTSGYNIRELAASIDEFLAPPDSRRTVLVGIGNLGRALLSHFSSKGSRMRVVAGFDADASIVNRVIHGVRIHAMDQLKTLISDEKLKMGVVAVPSYAAQEVADTLCEAGIRGIVNFTALRLIVPAHVFIENIDLASSLDKVSYYAYRKLAVR